MSKHTSGPWTRSGHTVYSSRSQCLVVRLPALTDAYGDETPEQIERWDADARLIAAAPDMLAVLEELDNTDSAMRDWDAVRAVIAKANGKL